MLRYTKENLPADQDTWPLWRKKVLASMVRIDGPFQVENSQGIQQCEDGFLAVDVSGFPYAIDYEEQKKLYESVGE